ncbi:MAG: hypothetical protein V3U85_00250 [Hyphomicrobium sp.]
MTSAVVVVQHPPQPTAESALNSSTANLAAGESFIGAPESTLGYAALAISCRSDTHMDILVEQGPDGINWDTFDTWSHHASASVGRTIAVVSAFFRVTATAIGIPTTFHRLHTLLVPVATVLPRTLTSSGNLRSTIIDDQHEGKETQFSAFGLLKIAQESILGDYRYDAASVPDKFDITTTGTGGYAICTGGTGFDLTTGASAASKIELESKTIHVYKSGRGHMLKQSIILHDTGVVGNIREWGLKSGDNGAFLRLDGTTLQWVILRNGVETVIDAANWDHPVEHDGNGHLWYLQLEWLGVGDLFLFYDERIVHTYHFTGTSTEFSIGTPDLSVWYKNENVANATDVKLTSGCASVIMEGGTLISGVDASGVTREVSVDSAGNLGVAVVVPSAPAGAAEVFISADTPLVVGLHDTTFVIPNGETFHLQQLIVGNEDPTKGARVEIIYYDGAAEHMVMRSYIAGFTTSIPFPGIGDARDGTAMVGDGSTKTIIIRRAKLTGTDIEIDAVVRGYTE